MNDLDKAGLGGLVAAKLTACQKQSTHTLQNIGDYLGMPRAYVSKQLSGDISMKHEMLAKYASLFNVSADWLLAPPGSDVALNNDVQNAAPSDTITVDSIRKETGSKTLTLNYHGTIDIPMNAIATALRT